MGKKNFSNADGNKNSRNSGSGGFGQLLAGMGFQVEEKNEEPVQNKYAGYDSDKEARQGRKQGQGRQGSGVYGQQGQGRQCSGAYGQQGQGRQGGGSNGQYRQGGASYGQQNRNGRNQNSRNTVRVLPISGGPHAPYNFVSTAPKVMEGTPQAHDMIGSEALYSGYITYRMTAQTPLMIDDGHGSFYRSADGSYAIPGSTIRGLIRNHVQILGFADVSKDMDDYYLMYRAVAGGCLSKEYADMLGSRPMPVNGRNMSVLTKVKAGYIRREGQKYFFYGNKGDSDGRFRKNEPDYYVVSEKYVWEKAQKEFKYILRDGGKHMQNFLPFIKKVNNGKTDYVGRENTSYVPYYEDVTYTTANGKVCGIAKNGLKNSGYVLSSGYIGKKKAFYVIPEIDLAAPVVVSEDPLINQKAINDAIIAFTIDYNRRESGIKEKNRSFFNLPVDGETRPVFYFIDDGKLYFGYTPHLRLMYRYSILNGQPQKNRPACDYAEALFGYATDEKAYKSRVSFTDARLTNDKTCRPQDEDSLILAEPKPTSYLEYLKQTDGQKVRTYNDRDFELRGVKQYWLQKKVQKNPEGASTNEKIRSKIAPIEAGSEFEGTVRFHNLTEAELGLLLWSIRLEKDSQINLGKAKAYGYGRACVAQTTLYLQNSQKAYDLAGGIFGIDPFEQQTDEKRDAFVATYQKVLAAWLGGGTNRTGQSVRTDREVIMANPSIRDFFGMKSAIKEGRDVTYMTLEEFKQHKQKNNPLPEAKAYL